MDFFVMAAAERVDRNSALRKVGTPMDWQHLERATAMST